MPTRTHMERALCSLAVVLAASAAGCSGRASAEPPAGADEAAIEGAPVNGGKAVTAARVLSLPVAEAVQPSSPGLAPAKRNEPAAKRAMSLTHVQSTCVMLAATQNTGIMNGTGGDGPSTSHGASLLTPTGTFNGGERDMLLQFDLGSIPAYATIHSATLTLWASSATGAGTVNAFFVTSPWTEMSTWSSFGGAYASPAAVSFANGGPFSTDTKISVDLSPMVQAWVDAARANDGILFSENNDSSDTVFWERRAPGGLAPSLAVCYGPAPTPGVALVCGGTTSSSQSYSMVGTLGQAPGGNVVSSGTQYRLHGGLVGATQAGP